MKMNTVLMSVTWARGAEETLRFVGLAHCLHRSPPNFLPYAFSTSTVSLSTPALPLPLPASSTTASLAFDFALNLKSASFHRPANPLPG